MTKRQFIAWAALCAYAAIAATATILSTTGATK